MLYVYWACKLFVVFYYCCGSLDSFFFCFEDWTLFQMTAAILVGSELHSKKELEGGGWLVREIITQIFSWAPGYHDSV